MHRARGRGLRCGRGRTVGPVRRIGRVGRLGARWPGSDGCSEEARGRGADRAMTPDPPRARILAVDDERQILRALRVILRSEGYDVLTAATVKEALDQAAAAHIDAAVVD